jgi:hypothetical protein
LTPSPPGSSQASGWWLIATYVSLQNRALLAEVRKELAELESRIILRLNGFGAAGAACSAAVGVRAWSAFQISATAVLRS